MNTYIKTYIRNSNHKAISNEIHTWRTTDRTKYIASELHTSINKEITIAKYMHQERTTSHIHKCVTKEIKTAHAK